jgi:hypothetical protein
MRCISCRAEMRVLQVSDHSMKTAGYEHQTLSAWGAKTDAGWHSRVTKRLGPVLAVADRY